VTVDEGFEVLGEVLVQRSVRAARFRHGDTFINGPPPELRELNNGHGLVVVLNYHLKATLEFLQHRWEIIRHLRVGHVDLFHMFDHTSLIGVGVDSLSFSVHEAGAAFEPGEIVDRGAGRWCGEKRGWRQRSAQFT